MTTVATMIVFQSFRPHVSPSPSSSTSTSSPINTHFSLSKNLGLPRLRDPTHQFRMKRRISEVPFVDTEDTDLSLPGSQVDDDDDDEIETNPTPEDLEYISQIKRVLELLRKNRDMLFSEVKLTITIEDPRELERRRLLGLDEFEGPTRDELASTLELVNEGKVPKDKIALKLLAEEMIQWPNLEVEVSKKGRGKSLYAKTTDTGVDPKEAAKRLNIDWDTAAQMADDVDDDVPDVPAALGFGALYLVSAFPIIIGVAVVLILFYNSLQ
ncbi:ycf3-interacting protein 1, chloroplastic [Impatiens glandulifera]|uniref:ycf3-interacting protein 1, chloroplastic n=1 Tax=Impatiens glandulifera TaxID=253017 RepID=UPI001FB0A7AC|nr:ycf3-interacting protein 1, chloroplastic [Impatiens glandulifera]